MNLTKAEVEHLARLARIQLSAVEQEAFTEQLNGILKFMEQLKQLDSVGIEMGSQIIPSVKVFRPDMIMPSLDPELALANAPERLGAFFKVPRVLETEE